MSRWREMIAMRKNTYGFYYSEEYYKCRKCNYSGTEDDSMELDDNDWKCLNCGDYIRIYTVDGSKRPYVIVRKLPNEIEEYDDVLLRFSNEPHTVLENTWKDGVYHIALKGYRRIKVEDDDWLNVVIGSWSGDKNELD
jgi:hypothetical protein